VRIDSGVYEGWTVPLDYDPLLAKLAAWANSRSAAIGRMKRALSEYTIAGIRTNRAFFGEIMDDAEFRAGRLSTAFLDEFFARRKSHEPALEAEAVAALAAILTQQKTATTSSTGSTSQWLQTGRETLLR
jgi:acetyl-CoA carboxylase biotin carboxylase subunit